MYSWIYFLSNTNRILYFEKKEKAKKKYHIILTLLINLATLFASNISSKNTTQRSAVLRSWSKHTKVDPLQQSFHSLSFYMPQAQDQTSRTQKQITIWWRMQLAVQFCKHHKLFKRPKSTWISTLKMHACDTALKLWKEHLLSWLVQRGIYLRLSNPCPLKMQAIPFLYHTSPTMRG